MRIDHYSMKFSMSFFARNIFYCICIYIWLVLGCKISKWKKNICMWTKPIWKISEPGTEGVKWFIFYIIKYQMEIIVNFWFKWVRTWITYVHKNVLQSPFCVGQRVWPGVDWLIYLVNFYWQKPFFLSQQVPIANSILVRGGVLCPFSVGFVWFKLVYVVS